MSTAEPRPDAGGPAAIAWPQAARWAAALRASGEPASLWPAGLAVVVVGAALVVLPLNGETRESALWVLVGAALAAAAVGARAWRTVPSAAVARLAPRPRLARLPHLLGAVALAAAVPLAIDLRDPALLALAALQSVIALLVAPRLTATAPLVALGALFGWAVALPVIWWQPAGQWLTRDLFDITVALLGLYLLTAKLCRSELRAQAPARWVPAVGAVAALLLLGFATLHTYPLFEVLSTHHWSFYVGPALLIRQGATPLWDVPAQYGLGSELALAWLPVPSLWTGLFALNAAANLVYALTLFLLVRAPNGDLVDQAASLLVAFFLVFGRVAYSSGLAGVQLFPSTGGMRFAWGLLLVLVAVRAAQRHVLGLPTGRLLVLGCGVWLIGCVWSFESAVYCSCAWLPALALLRWRSRRRLLLLPPALAMVAVAVTAAAVSAHAGHAPDPRTLFEYAVAYGTDYGTLPIAPNGPVWALLLGFAVAVLALAAGRGGADAGLAAAAGLLWSTASYFVARSHASQVVNVSPALAAAMLLALRAPALARSVLPRQAVAAVLTAFVIGPSAFELGVYNFVHQVPQPTRIDALRPHVAPALQALILRAGLRAGDPVAYVGPESLSSLMPVWRDASGHEVTESPLWLPLAPAAQLGPLTPARRDVYLARFAADHPDGGWLVQADRTPDFDMTGVDAWLASHYRVAETVSGDGWRLTRYEHR